MIFSDNFNDYTPGQTSTQADTGLTVGAFGNLPGWNATGTHVVHAVQRSAGDWAIMLFDTNTITLSSGIAANQLGVIYSVSFQIAGATYSDESQATIAPQDFLHFNILNLNSSVVTSANVATPSFSDSANNPFINASFSYIGTGSGNVLIQISDTVQDNRFAGAIDNLVVAPEPASITLFGASLVGLAFVRRRLGIAAKPRKTGLPAL